MRLPTSDSKEHVGTLDWVRVYSLTIEGQLNIDLPNIRRTAERL